MNRTISIPSAITFLAIALYACKYDGSAIGQVKVKNISQARSASPLNISSSESMEKSSSSANSLEKNPVVFFESVSLFDVSHPKVDGISYLSSGARSTSPIGFSLPSEADLPLSPAFIPVSGGVISVIPDSDTVSIGFTDTLTLDVKTLITPDETPNSVSASWNGDVIAWTDIQGHAYLYSSSSKLNQVSGVSTPASSAPIQIDTSGVKADWIKVSSNGTQLMVGSRSAAKVWVHSLVGGTTNPDQKNEYAATNGVIHPQGKWMALVESDGIDNHSIAVYDGPDHRVATLKTGNQVPHELAWSSLGDKEHKLVYWTQSAPRRFELRTVDVESGKDMKITDFKLASQARNGIVCPAATANDVFYSDFRNGTYVIMRATFQSGYWETSVFAKTDSDREGLVCPKIRNSIGKGGSGK